MTVQKKHRPEFSVVIPTYNRVTLLKQCIESLLRQDFDPPDHEIIVVNDGSTDGTSEYLHSFPPEGRVRFVETPDAGPARARNRGASVARGDILVFTDDDCTYPRTWLRDLRRAMDIKKAVAVGGSVHNRIMDNVLTQVYDETNRFLAKRINKEEGKARFLTTNNFACQRSVFEKYGGFDERFFIGAEDREFVSRLIASGEVVCYSPEIVIEHYHRFSLKSFFFLLYRQGRGSYLYYRVVGKEKNLNSKPLSFREYMEMIRETSSDPRLLRRISKGSLALLAQFFVLLGYVSASWEGITDLRQERTEHAASAASGERGTMFGLLSFLGGSTFSSAFGFVSFLVIANVLSIAEFGVFMVAFSMEAIVSTIAGLGIPTSVTRYASEYSKRNDESGASSILKSGLALQVILIACFAILAFLLSDYVTGSLLNVQLPRALLLAVLVGACGSISYDYVTSIYSIYLRFLDLTLLRSVVALVRFMLVTVVALSAVGSPVYLFWAFILPNWLGLGIASFAFYRTVRGKGSPQPAYFRSILQYGGWQTATSVTRLSTTHFGSLLLATYSTEHEVGVFGLGLTLSFVFGVIGAAIGSYFMPIGARVKSISEVPSFVQRTLRLVLPISILCLLSLLFAYPLVNLFYGSTRLAALPSFIFLSFPAIVGMTFIAVNVLFHYFFKPYYITFASMFRTAVFFLASVYVARFGATAVAATFCGAGLLTIALSFVLLRLEFRKSGLRVDIHLWRTFGFSTKEPG